MNDLKLVLRSLKGCCRGNVCGGNRRPIHTSDLSSHAICKISAYCEKCNHRPIYGTLLLIGLWVQLLYAARLQANKLPDSMDAGEPVNWPINNNYQAARGIAGCATVYLRRSTFDVRPTTLASSYIGWQWHSFVSYLCQLIFAAIL